MKRMLIVATMILFGNQTLAVNSPFTFQGSLEDAGIPANGTYDLQFIVKNSGGTVLTAASTLEDVNVVNGVFTVQLDFGEIVFSGLDRRLGVSVRPGASSGSFVALTPDLPINASPYALTSNTAISADIASDVTDFAIDPIDIASEAVTTEKIRNDAVTADKLASNSVSIASFTGGNGSGAITYNIGASDCDEVNITFGGVAAGDFVVLNTDPLPEDVTVIALNAPAANTMRIKICNAGPATQSLSSIGVRYVSFR